MSQSTFSPAMGKKNPFMMITWDFIWIILRIFLLLTPLSCLRPVNTLSYAITNDEDDDGTRAAFDEEIRLSGLDTSYAKFPQWKPCRNGSLSFQFKTTHPNGLLLYVDSLSNFLEIKLFAGVVRVRYNLGYDLSASGLLGNHLSDDLWHSLYFKRAGNISILVIDAQNITIRPPAQTLVTSHDLGDPRQDPAFVYLGGLPEDFKSMQKLRSLALISAAYEPHFNGVFKGVKYRNCGGEMTSERPLETRGVSVIPQLNSGECDARKPCQNGGECHDLEVGYFCDCSGTNFDGPDCEHPKEPAEVTFRGSQYIRYEMFDREKNGLKPYPIMSSKERIELEFKTNTPRGFIFYTGYLQNRMLVYLSDGNLYVEIDLGQGAKSVEVPPSLKFDDDSWHSLVIERERFNVTFSLQVDGAIVGSLVVPGSLELMAAQTVTVGAAASDLVFPSSQGMAGFVGCMRSVKFISDAVSLDLVQMAKNGVYGISTHGNIHFQCEPITETPPVTIRNPSSFLVVPAWRIRLEEGPDVNHKLSFTFRTTEAYGLLMYAYGQGKTRQFFGFDIYDGYLQLIVDYGYHNLTLFPETINYSNARINDGNVHKFSLIMFIDTSNCPHVVNGRPAKYALNTVLDGTVTRLCLAQAIKLEGGFVVGSYIEDHLVAEIISARAWSVSKSLGFVGCIWDMSMDDDYVYLDRLAEGTTGVSIGCSSLPRQCTERTCLNEGVCVDGWNRFVCECVATSFTGPICADRKLKK